MCLFTVDFYRQCFDGRERAFADHKSRVEVTRVVVVVVCLCELFGCCWTLCLGWFSVVAWKNILFIVVLLVLNVAHENWGWTAALVRGCLIFQAIDGKIIARNQSHFVAQQLKTLPFFVIQL